MSRHEFEPTEEQRRQVEAMAGYGVPQEDIAIVIDISEPTLRKHFRRELDLGIAKANARVGKSLFDQAVKGNVTAAIFWTKSRMGWRETVRQELTGPNGGPIETRDVGGIERLKSRLASLAVGGAADSSPSESDAAGTG